MENKSNSNFKTNSEASFIVGKLIDTVRINAVSQTQKAGKIVWVKQRRPLMDGIIALGNIFLRLSQSRIIMFPNCREWWEWELHCFRLLYGDEIAADSFGQRGFWVETIPGKSLLSRLSDSQYTSLNTSLSEEMFRAAGLEFRRVHSLWCDRLWCKDTQHKRSQPQGCYHTQNFWSHGDPHLANVLYDESTNRAYLIDFETKHEPGLTATERHADDLLVFILDTLGRLQESEAILFSKAFLLSYGNKEVLQSLKQRLTVPQGWERVLWVTRTNYLPKLELKYRLESLKKLF
ncbi:MAG: hypothetical protein AAF378_03875 [Cyanobacteria bacterium P01_A01_bin.84]